MANTRATFSSKLLQNFMLIVANEIGEKNLPIVLNKSRLPVEWADSKHLENLGN